MYIKCIISSCFCYTLGLIHLLHCSAPVYVHSVYASHTIRPTAFDEVAWKADVSIIIAPFHILHASRDILCTETPHIPNISKLR
jgi:hypothetical protein